jgi:hypothetical protein
LPDPPPPVPTSVHVDWPSSPPWVCHYGWTLTKVLTDKPQLYIIIVTNYIVSDLEEGTIYVCQPILTISASHSSFTDREMLDTAIW